MNLAKLVFNYTNSGRKFSFIDTLNVKSGWLSVSKLINSSFEEQEYLLISAICNDGVEIEADLIDKLMELDVTSIKDINEQIPEEIINHQKYQELQTIKEIGLKNKEYFLQESKKLDEWSDNKEYFLQESKKLDEWSDDLKDNLQLEIKEIEKQIKEKKKEFDNSLDLDLEQMLDIKDQMNKLKRKRDKKMRELYDEQDRIDEENERLQAEMRSRIKGSTQVKPIFTIQFEIK